MKKVVLFWSFISLLLITNAQNSVDKGRFQFKVAKGIFIGSMINSYSFDTDNASLNRGSSNIGAFQNRFTLHYNTHKNFSLGLDFLGHTLNGDSANYNSGGLGILAQYYFINKPKMNIYFEANFGSLSSKWDGKNQAEPASLSGNGSYNSFSLGLNKYFGKIIGLYLQSGFMRQGFQINNFSLNGESKDYLENIKVEDIKYLFGGGYVNIGLTIKLRNKSPKSE